MLISMSIQEKNMILNLNMMNSGVRREFAITPLQTETTETPNIIIIIEAKLLQQPKRSCLAEVAG